MSLNINGSTRAIDKARSTGAEFELNGEIAPGWDLSANYSYDQAEIVNDRVNPDNNGNRLQNAPRHAGALYLSHEMQISSLPGSFRLGGGARYVGSRAGDPITVSPCPTMWWQTVSWHGTTACSVKKRSCV